MFAPGVGVFFFSYRKTKPESKRLRLKPAAHLFFLALAVIFFFGFGEEISWGQRIFHIQTPQSLMKTNIQKELNIHNIDMFNLVGKDNQMKPLWKRYLTTAVGLFHVFSSLFCLIIPFAYRYFAFARKGLLKISFSVVPLRLGLFFALSWIFYKILVIRLSDQGREFLSSLAEIKESQIAFLFVVIAFYFLNSASRLKPKKESERRPNP